MREGWRNAALGEVCELIKRGIAPRYTASGGIRVVNQKCIRDHLVNMDLARRHDSASRPVNSERYIKQGDVLVNSTGTGTLGRIAQMRSQPDEPTTVDTHVTIVRPLKDRFYSDFFGYMLMMIEDEIINSGEGASGQTELQRTKLENNFRVSYPESKEEQKRIVAILDEALAGIATAVANTEKNLANARELFESYLNAVFLKNAHVWTRRRLEEVCEKITVGHVGSMAKRYRAKGIPLLRSQNIRPFRVSLENVVYIDEEFHSELKKSALKPGDLGIVRTGYPGTAAVIPESLPISNCSDLVIVRPSDQVLAHFLALVFNSTFGKQTVAGVLVGAAQKHFNVTAAKAALVPIPPLEAQEQVIADCREVREECGRLEDNSTRKLTALAELKQSLLQNAFSGELTTASQHEMESALA